MIDYSIYLVTDDPSRYAGNWLDNVRAAVEGGVTCVQYRDTESGPDERFRRVRALQDALSGRVPLVVNNEAELAAAVRADGVHVGQGDLPPSVVRKIVGPHCEIGLSITILEDLARASSGDARRAEADDSGASAPQLTFADAIGIGPVFDARKTKADAATAMGVAGLREIVSRARERAGEAALATVAIGGIALANAAEVLSSGVGGLAIVSAFSRADDPFAVARQFRGLMK